MSQASIFEVIVDVVSAYIKQASDLIHLASLETRLALKTLVAIAILMFMLGTMLTAFWIALLALLFFYLISLNFTFVSATSIVFVVIAVSLAIVCLIMYRIKGNLFFLHTRNQLFGDDKRKMKHARIKRKN